MATFSGKSNIEEIHSLSVIMSSSKLVFVTEIFYVSNYQTNLFITRHANILAPLSSTKYDIIRYLYHIFIIMI